jgi:hypothetical protein
MNKTAGKIVIQFNEYFHATDFSVMLSLPLEAGQVVTKYQYRRSWNNN